GRVAAVHAASGEVEHDIRAVDDRAHRTRVVPARGPARASDRGDLVTILPQPLDEEAAHEPGCSGDHPPRHREPPIRTVASCDFVAFTSPKRQTRTIRGGVLRTIRGGCSREERGLEGVEAHAAEVEGALVEVLE